MKGIHLLRKWHVCTKVQRADFAFNAANRAAEACMYTTDAPCWRLFLRHSLPSLLCTWFKQSTWYYIWCPFPAGIFFRGEDEAAAGAAAVRNGKAVHVLTTGLVSCVLGLGTAAVRSTTFLRSFQETRRTCIRTW